MTNTKIINNNGFSLVEVLVYTALLVILMFGVISFSLSITGIYVKGKALEEVLYNARHIEQVLEFYIKEEAREIISPLPGHSRSSLSMLLTDGSQADIHLTDGQLMEIIAREAPLAISSNEIIISDFLVENIPSVSGIDSLSISCKIAFANKDSMEYRYQLDFKTTLNTNFHE